MPVTLTPNEIESWLRESNPVTPSPERVSELEQEMPWFLLPATLLLKRSGSTLPEEERCRLLSRMAIGASSLPDMELAVDADLSAAMAQFYPETETVSTPTTENAIDKFISTYGNPDPREEELLTRLIFNPTPDYAQILAQEEESSTPSPNEAPHGSQDELINSFIIKSKASGGQFPPVNPQPEPPAPQIQTQSVSKPEPEIDSLPSEGLAQIYIRRGNYARAYEIISQLNLNFPEKSIYFADQLRFLEKLMRLTGAAAKTRE